MQSARMFDSCFGICCGHRFPIPVTGKIIKGSSKTFIDNKGAATVGDTVQFICGHTGTIARGSSSVMVDGKPIARVFDSVLGIVIGYIIMGSSKTDSK
jgi:uncharacterized Zn-binding protein involved in type VI secretion